MSTRSGPPSDEGSGDEIRPHGDDRDSSEESSEEDPEEARKIAEGFIVEDEDEDEPTEEEDAEARRRRRKERKEKKKRRREERARRKAEEGEISEDDLDLLNENENRGLAGPSRKPLKRLRRRSEGSPDEGGALDPLRNMFADDADRRFEDEDEDDLGDFIEEDEEDEGAKGETEEQRRERKREEKLKRREANKTRPDLPGVDKQSWDEIFDVFGDGEDYLWAMQGEGMDEDEYEESQKKEMRLEDVFDPSEIKERRLQDEDKTIASTDRPERFQIVNSTLSDNPVFAPEGLYPPPELATQYLWDKISTRTRYLFCDMEPDNSYPPQTRPDEYVLPAPRRTDLRETYRQAVSTALNMMFVQHLEVPYLWHYKRDTFSVLEAQGRSIVQFLERDELWTLYNLGIKFRAIYDRLEATRTAWSKIKAMKPDLTDPYLTQTLLASVCMMSVEAASEGFEWLNYHYADEMRRIKEDETLLDESKKKLPQAMSGDVRSGPILKLVEAFGVSVGAVANTFNDQEGVPPTLVNPEKMPLDLAEEYCGEGTPFLTPEDALNAASHILTIDFSKDPSIRQQSRDFIDTLGAVSVTPTDRGMSVIDEYHFCYTFKFLTNKPMYTFKDTPQFLHMLKAEEEGLVNISIGVDSEDVTGFVNTLVRCCHSHDYGEISTAWNEQRRIVCENVISKYLMPSASKWAKEHLRAQAEEYVAEQCRKELEFRVNVRPFATQHMELGETPSVLAITNGRGDIRDAVVAIMLDDEGNIRAQSKFDNLKDPAERNSFIELVEKRQPRVIVVGGLSVQAGKLRDDAALALRESAIRQSGENPPIAEGYGPDPEAYKAALNEYDQRLEQYLKPLIFVSDATARMYMHSEEAEREHPSLPLNGKYALALARYTQNPLNAYCKLGRKITEVTFMEHHQKLISQEKLLVHLERGLVNSVCFMGIEVNSCVADAYQRAMLPFIAGLGPRKANALVNGVQRLGAMMNRLQFSDTGLFGPTVFENVAGFLSIEHDLKEIMLEENNPQEQPDPLDMTRIHPEDYEFAQKLCQDALDLDVEDVEGQHKSEVVLQLMQKEDRTRRLTQLSIDDYAFNLQKIGEGSKRYILSQIIAELISYRADRRPGFYVPTDWEILTMLTGETERTIGRGLRVTATVRKVLSSRAFCQLDSGIDAMLEREYVADESMQISSCEEVLKARQSVKAVVIIPEPSRFSVRISIRPSDIAQSVQFLQPFREDPYNDTNRQKLSEEAAAQRRRREAGAVKRQVNHPNWHTMNSGQAEQFLASQHRGDVVIRPSSKGSDHLAVTWKVDEDIYQHIDVQEIDKPNEYSLGKILRVGGKYSYTDLDDLIINHVKAMTRKVEEVILSEKYKPEDELEAYLKNYVQAHPGRSMYGFTLDSDRPGYVKLCFLNKSSKDGGVIQTWPVKILPGAFQLSTAVVPGVTELCNAFKAQYSSRLQEQGSGGKTPGIRAGKTPLGGRTPGGRTPGYPGVIPVAVPGGRTPAIAGLDPRQMGGAAYGMVQGQGRTPIRPGMTPNPYNNSGGPPMQGYGSATPYGMNGGAGGYPPSGPSGGMPPQGYGMPTPNPHQHPHQHQQGGPPRPPLGMNPERAAMLSRQGGGGNGY